MQRELPAHICTCIAAAITRCQTFDMPQKFIGKLQIGNEEIIDEESDTNNHREFTFFNHLTNKNEIINKIIGDKTNIHGQVDFYYSDKLDETNHSHTTFNDTRSGTLQACWYPCSFWPAATG